MYGRFLSTEAAGALLDAAFEVRRSSMGLLESGMFALSRTCKINGSISATSLSSVQYDGIQIVPDYEYLIVPMKLS